MTDRTDMNKSETQSESREADPMMLLLKEAVPRIDDDLTLQRDLWPAMLRRLEEPATRGATAVPWFDWALAGGLVAFAAIAPRTIPVILYYL
jgi:hypothetical protein